MRSTFKDSSSLPTHAMRKFIEILLTQCTGILENTGFVWFSQSGATGPNCGKPESWHELSSWHEDRPSPTESYSTHLRDAKIR